MNEDIKLFPIKDVNGNDIHDGDTVLYNGDSFVLMYMDKGDTEWILHPCNHNQSNDVNLDDIALHLTDESIKLELIWNSLVKND